MRSLSDTWGKLRATPSRQLLFSVIAAGLSLMTIGFVLYASVFLARRVNESFSAEVETAPTSVVQFDIDGFDRLRLTQ